MQQKINELHWLDEDGNPAGGYTTSTGLTVIWQNGPLVDKETGERLEPSGCFVETLLAAAEGRLEFYQQGKFASDYNAEALEHIEAALAALHRRTADREARGVEGTHNV